MSAQHKPEVSAHHAAAADAPPPVAVASPAADVVSGATPADPAPDIAALLQKVEAEAAELAGESTEVATADADTGTVAE